MDNFSDFGASGGIGALFGAILTWAGFKSRLDAQDARIATLEQSTVNNQAYQEHTKNCCGHFHRIEDMLDEVRGDVKIILRGDQL